MRLRNKRGRDEEQAGVRVDPPPSRRTKAFSSPNSTGEEKRRTRGGDQNKDPCAETGDRSAVVDGMLDGPGGCSALIPQVLLARMGFGDGDRELESPDASSLPHESASRQRAACGAARSSDNDCADTTIAGGKASSERVRQESSAECVQASMSQRLQPPASLRRKAQESPRTREGEQILQESPLPREGEQLAGDRRRAEGRNRKGAKHLQQFDDFGGWRAFSNYIREEISDHRSLLHPQIDVAPPLGVATSRFELPKLLAVPIKLEKTILVGFLVCADAFLYNFTLLPIRSLFGLGEESQHDRDMSDRRVEEGVMDKE